MCAQYVHGHSVRVRCVCVCVCTTSCCIPGRRLPTCVCHWTPTTAFVGHQHVPSAANQHTFWRSLVHSCWTSSMEQSANPAARVRHYAQTTLTSTQNASIWSLTAAALSDSVFLCAVYKLAYLLTYLLTGNVGCCVLSETKKFYSLLSRIGTDFSLMCRLFPGRNRPELKVRLLHV